MKKYLKFIILIGLIVVAVGYTYYIRPLVDDELYNYGYSISILNGLVPYKDFNMIIPPLFSYIFSLVLLMFGKKLIIYHIFIALLVVIITYLTYKKVGMSAIIIYLLLLVYPYTGYNMFCLFLFFILLNIKENKYTEIIEAILISMMILTKHSLGLLIIPSLIYSKNKKKIFSIYAISGLIFLLYLLFNNTLLSFIDYGILGMFDFTNKNGTGISILMVVEVFLIIGLIYLTIKTKRKDIFYILMFQIMTFPIVNYVHFMISFIPVIYLILTKIHKNKYFVFLTMVGILPFFITLNLMELVKNNNYLYLEHYPVDNFMKGRVVNRVTAGFINDVSEEIKTLPEYEIYVFGNFSYQVKLNLNLPINKFDNINNGNMGYNGVKKYLKEIKTNCKEKKCLFIMNDGEAREQINQTNRDILKYVQKNYRKEYSSNIFSVYKS